MCVARVLGSGCLYVWLFREEREREREDPIGGFEVFAGNFAVGSSFQVLFQKNSTKFQLFKINLL